MPTPVPAPPNDASSTRRGLMGIAAQTFAGVKSFINPIRLALLGTGDLPSGGPELEGQLAYDSTLKRPRVHTGAGWTPVALSVSGTQATTLEEHLASTDAHTDANIAYTGGYQMWANGDEVEMAANLGELGVALFQALASADGAYRIGATPGGTLTGTNIRAQLAELDTNKISSASLSAVGGSLLVGGAAKAGTTFSLAAGSLKVQVEQLLAHLNTVRDDITPPTFLSLATDWVGDVSYAKDCGGWGHVLGNVENQTDGTQGENILIGTLPVGNRPTKPVWARGTVLNISGVPTGGDVAVVIDTTGNVMIKGIVLQGQYVTLDFPAFKCA